MTKAYDRELQKLATGKAKALGYDFIHSGVYAMVSGPSFETPAELRLINTVSSQL